jgi:capsular polysaccharide export protein
MFRGGLTVFKGKRVLLLQGPVGPFFRRLARDLTQAGAQVFKINFNGGDWLFYPGDAFNYRGRMEDWPAYFEQMLEQLSVDVTMLFGDCRPIHSAAHEIAHRRGLEIGVFEEGYIRPHYITLERFGVNENSTLPRSPIFYFNTAPVPKDTPLHLGNTFWYAVRWTVLYYLAASLLKWIFPNYRHHRPLGWAEALPWWRSLWRKGYYALKERGMLNRLSGELSGRFFLVPLQVHNDAQILEHSDYSDVINFLDDVMTSFASNAQRSKFLVIKHHPMDRGYSDYSEFIAERAEQLGLQDRCFYIHDQHLPTLLNNACGVVVVNSTVGLSAMLHGVPVKVCGKALYNMKGLTYQSSLSRFWREAQHAKPNERLLQAFHDYLVWHSQLNGSFYKRLPIVASAAGLRWMIEAEPAAEQPQKSVGRSAA